MVDWDRNGELGSEPAQYGLFRQRDYRLAGQCLASEDRGHPSAKTRSNGAKSVKEETDAP